MVLGLYCSNPPFTFYASPGHSARTSGSAWRLICVYTFCLFTQLQSASMSHKTGFHWFWQSEREHTRAVLHFLKSLLTGTLRAQLLWNILYVHTDLFILKKERKEKEKNIHLHVFLLIYRCVVCDVSDQFHLCLSHGASNSRRRSAQWHFLLFSYFWKQYSPFS